jgi:hypothetical protein
VSLESAAWRPRAVGEQRLAEKLAALGNSVIALRGLQLPDGRTTLDHVVVGPAGVYLISATHFRGAKVAIARAEDRSGASRDRLMVAGRDRTRLAAALEGQAAAVRATLEASTEFAQVPVATALCFIDADFPLFATLEIGPVRVMRLAGTTKMVVGAGPFGSAERQHIARYLALHFPPSAAHG